MGHSIAAKYAARPAAHFVRPSSRARERRLGLATMSPFAPAGRRVTVLRGGDRTATTTRPAVRDGSLKPAVRMRWTGSGRPVPSRRASADAAPWQG